MSAGHGAEFAHLGEEEYKKALHDPRLVTFLNRGFRVVTRYDIPYLGGYSHDGSTIYLDKDAAGIPELKDGKRVYPTRLLCGGIITHEHWEKSILDAWGQTYAHAHELATHAEHVYVRDALHMDPHVYEKVWRPVIKFAEKKLHMPGIQLPPDLDRTPYQS